MPSETKTDTLAAPLQEDHFAPLNTKGHINGASIPSLKEYASQLRAIGEAQLASPHPPTPKSKPAPTKAETFEYGAPPSKCRISRPVELLRNSYDVVVVGSGYGGGVAASRMARGGQSVCVLERGKEKWPGEYPSTLAEAIPELHVSGLAAPGDLSGTMVEGGDQTGLYHLILGAGQNVFVGNGLGGTSLLNANVFLEADDGTLGLDCWPHELRQKGALAKYYDRASSVLQPAAYPKNFPTLPKLSTLEKQANLLGQSNKFSRVRQTTRFEDGPNSTGVYMHASKLTGQDSTGVNDGSKSSTLVTYLSDAWNWGAEIFCECEVRHIEQHSSGQGYLVCFAWHGSKRGAFRDNIYEDLMWVHARECLFLGAGTLGTTEILLRSRQRGFPLSPKVGTQMSGNGDILAFGYNTDEHVNAMGRESPYQDAPIGPTITGIIDCRDQLNPLDGYVIEEGAVPAALVPLLQAMLEATSKLSQNAQPSQSSISETFKRVVRQCTPLMPYYAKGAMESTQVYLIMSHDSNQAVLTLVGDKPQLKFLGVGRSESVQQLNEILREATVAIGGTYVNSPFYSLFGEQEITVHPIGGAIMSKDGTGATGVVNHCGQAFTGSGSEVHPGLVVVDGSVVPTALGANPFATITALAERSVEHVAQQHGILIDYDTSNGILNLFGKPAHPVTQSCETQVEKTEAKLALSKAISAPGISFTEVMSGYIHQGKITDYQAAFATARGLCEEARFFLSVKSWDVNQLVHSPRHSATLTGSLACALPGSPFMVNQGNFELFDLYSGASNTKNLSYNFTMTSSAGEPVHFHGYKVVNTSVAFSPTSFWKATTTLYVTLTKPDGSMLGRGILRIQPADFAAELLTLQPHASSIIGKIKATAAFLGYFTAQSAGLFLSPFLQQQWPSQGYVGYACEDSPSREFTVTAVDGVESKMHVWEPISPQAGNPGGEHPPTILMVPGAAVNHLIFTMPTLPPETTVVHFLRTAGYRIYTVCHRVGMNPSNERGPTTFDARLDVGAAVDEIRRRQGGRKIYVIAHCMGSVAFASGLLDGVVDTSMIAGITASQVFMNPKWYIENIIKTLSPIPLDVAYKKLLGNWYSLRPSKSDGYAQQAINQLSRLYPVGSRSEICNSVSCHRCSLVFGRLWSHANLNDATHSQIDRFFGGVNMNWLHHAMHFGRVEYVTTNPPLQTSLVTPANVQRLRGIPILFLSGADSQVFTPETTDISYSILRRTFGEQDYERVVLEGYGHLDPWMGKAAYRDVFPLVGAHVDKVMKGQSS